MLNSTMNEPFATEASDVSGLADKLARNKKRVVAFALLLLVTSIALGSLAVFWNNGVVLLLQVAGFLALGYLLVSVLQANVASFNHSEKLLYALLLAIVVLVAVGAFYFISAGYPWQTAFTAGCAFLLPYMVAEAWRLFAALSIQSAPAWRYSAELPLQKSTTFLNSIPIRFNVKAHRLGWEQHLVSFRAPVRMKLGLLFYHMVQERNSSTAQPVKLVDAENEPYQWIFFVRSWGFTRYLNPELNLIENGIKENAVVMVQQLLEQSHITA